MAHRAATTAALGLLALLAATGTAHAGGTLFTVDTRPVLSGPAWAGDRVAWASTEPRSIGVHVARPDGSGHIARTVATPWAPSEGLASATIAASGQRVATRFQISRCTGGCKYHAYEFSQATDSAALGEQPERVRYDCQTTTPSINRIDVSEHALAYACDGTNVRVRDFAAPAGTPDSPAYPADEFELAGPYLATVERKGSLLTLREWHTGTERLRFEGVQSFWLQADGKVLFGRERNGSTEVVWASPDSPEPRVVPVGPRAQALLGFAQDRVAVRRAGGADVRALDGSVVASADHPLLPFAPAFDGSRLTWSTQPCALLGIVVWDVQGEAPSMPAGPCPRAVNRRAVLKAIADEGGTYGYGRVSTVLECPAAPRLGCSGPLSLRLGPGRDALDLARGTYRLVPGERRKVSLGLLKRRICIAGRAAARPVLEIGAFGRDGGTPAAVKRRRVRMAGVEEALAAC